LAAGGYSASGLVAIFGSPMTFTLISRSLARSEARSLLSRRLLWATLVAWVGLWFFLVSLAVVGLTGQKDTALSPWVSLSNRFLIVTYCIWFMTAASGLGWRDRMQFDQSKLGN
jgi:quinol-cytochrome oxidoreductase complex cytochrome b subunit